MKSKTVIYLTDGTELFLQHIDTEEKMAEIIKAIKRDGFLDWTEEEKKRRNIVFYHVMRSMQFIKGDE
jgi:hypothetical protein